MKSLSPDMPSTPTCSKNLIDYFSITKHFSRFRVDPAIYRQATGEYKQNSLSVFSPPMSILACRSVAILAFVKPKCDGIRLSVAVYSGVREWLMSNGLSGLTWKVASIYKTTEPFLVLLVGFV